MDVYTGNELNNVEIAYKREIKYGETIHSFLYTQDNQEIELKEDIDEASSFSSIENKSFIEDNIVDEEELSDGYTEEDESDDDFDDYDDENDMILDDEVEDEISDDEEF